MKFEIFSEEIQIRYQDIKNMLIALIIVSIANHIFLNIVPDQLFGDYEQLKLLDPIYRLVSILGLAAIGLIAAKLSKDKNTQTLKWLAVDYLIIIGLIQLFFSILRTGQETAIYAPVNPPPLIFLSSIFLDVCIVYFWLYLINDRNRSKTYESIKLALVYSTTVLIVPYLWWSLMHGLGASQIEFQIATIRFLENTFFAIPIAYYAKEKKVDKWAYVFGVVLIIKAVAPYMGTVIDGIEVAIQGVTQVIALAVLAKLAKMKLD